MDHLFANTVAADYDVTVAAVELQLAKLKRKIEAHKAKVKTNDPKNWGYLDDLCKVESGLADLLALLN